jgi:DNA ligase-1
MKIFVSIIFIYFTLFAFEVQKPKVYDDQDIKGWFMSEKLDGIRGYWDGEKLYTKNGNPINTPEYFIKNFPPFALDGELWSKRNDFEFIQSVVLDDTPSDDWKKISFNIFEVPDTQGDFTKRVKKAKEWFQHHPNNSVKVIPQQVCKGEDHLQEYLEKIVALKGEGVIVKDPTKNYNTGRSPHILKVKKVLDMEGEIIGYNNRDDNKTLKSYQIKLQNGVVFNLGGGLSNKQRVNPLNIGEMVTFKYYGFTKYGKPKFASFLRVRIKE